MTKAKKKSKPVDWEAIKPFLKKPNRIVQPPPSEWELPKKMFYA